MNDATRRLATISTFVAVIVVVLATCDVVVKTSE